MKVPWLKYNFIALSAANWAALNYFIFLHPAYKSKLDQK